ncbi:MAG TPA: hypothetical protein VG435_17240, partial [Acidimicrobiales bacterium]|nr:hypothetical protein [Acidimicrobiales bacterium]
MTSTRGQSRFVTFVALSTWSFLVWVVLSWTLTLEQMVTGAIVAMAAGVALTPLGPVVGPWWFL